MRRLLIPLVVGALIVSCTDEGADEDTTTTTASEMTTTSAANPPETTAPATSTTGPPPTTTTVAPTTTATAPSSPGIIEGAEGSGCAPGGDDLPTGLWFGRVDSFDEEGISFDLACWFSGDAATAAAAEDGEESPPPNDYYVRNENEQLRFLAVSADTPVLWYLSGDPNDSQSGTFVEWTDFLSQRDFYLGIWVTIANGEVTQIEEQWVP